MPPPNESKTGHQEATEAKASSAGSVRATLLQITTNRYLLGVLLLVALALGAALMIHVSRPVPPPPATPPHPEIDLGEYFFLPDPRDANGPSEIRFSLHVTLLNENEAAARAELINRSSRIREVVEQLLRRAKLADFEDVSLSGLKRQIQVEVNEALGMRAVSSVVITELRRRYAAPLPARTETSPRS